MENNFLGLVTRCLNDFFENDGNCSDTEKWLGITITKFLPDMPENEALENSREIVDTVNSLNIRLQSAQQASDIEQWFREELDKQTENCSDAEKGKILSQAFNGLSEAESGFTGEDPEKATEIPDDEWDNLSVIQMSSDVVKKCGKAALNSLAAYSDTADEPAKDAVPNEKLKNALVSSIGTAVDTGVKCAASGAVFIAHKKGLLNKILPANTSVKEITNIAVGAVENIKTFAALGSGKCTTQEAIDRAQRNAVARVVDVVAEKSPAIGRKIGSVFGPVGAAVGETIGRGISYLAKTEVRDFIETGLNKVCTFARNACSKVVSSVKEAFNKVKSKLFS